eukprot:13550868-Heterocapsa_arctica.AAC.1
MLEVMDMASSFNEAWVANFEDMCKRSDSNALVSECVGGAVNGALPAVAAKLLRFTTLAAQFKPLVSEARVDRFNSALKDAVGQAERLR